MVHRCKHPCFTSQLWLPYLAFCFDLPGCFWDLHIWSRTMGSKSGKLWYVLQIMTEGENLVFFSNSLPTKLPGDTPSQAGSHLTKPILDSGPSESPIVVSWPSLHPSLLSSSPALLSLAPGLQPPLTTIYNGWVTWRKELIKQKGSYLLLPMKKDQTNWIKVYKWYPLAWELDLSGSDISLGLVQQWM